MEEDPSLEARVLREHVASVYTGHTAAVMAHLGFTGAVALFGYFELRQGLGMVFFWVGLTVAVDIYALVARRWTPAVPLEQTPYWARKYTRLVTLISLATAPVPFYYVSATDVAMSTVFTVAIMSGWTRAVQGRWPLKAAMFGYGLPMIVGLIGALIWHYSALNGFLAAVCAANLVLTLRIGVQQNRRLTESLLLRFENEELAARLKAQVAATERASAEKTRFLATASHDLRQPMHAIALFGATMENALREHPERGNAERLMRAVDALGASLDTMLDISRLDAGVVASAPRAFKVDALLLVLHNTFSAAAEQKGLQLRMRASELWVTSDPHLLYRMLSNLIDNAIKYTPQGGLTVRARSRGDRVWLEVRDTGIGMVDDQLGRIFEEFYQIDNPGRDRARGLGIGLSIVQRLSRLLRHPVQVYSRLGRGTHFRLIVPAAEPMPEAPGDVLFDDFDTSVRHAFAVPRLRGRVLLIDDEAEIREAMMQLLRAYSIEAVAVADEAAAAEVLLQAGATGNPFAMLLCDYRLAGGADGLEVGLRLRERFDLRVPLMLITGETAPDRLLHVRASGVSTLFKPVTAATLLQAMADLSATERDEAAEGDAAAS